MFTLKEEVGDRKNYFTPEQRARLNSVYVRKMKVYRSDFECSNELCVNWHRTAISTIHDIDAVAAMLCHYILSQYRMHTKLQPDELTYSLF